MRNLRTQYTKGQLLESEIDIDPVVQFSNWYAEYLEESPLDANAMTLSTVDLQGRPDARIVLLKGLENGGFVFFTNYQSKKGMELERNPFAHLLFFWVKQERQVRVLGKVEKLPFEENSKYFKSRPIESQIGAITSNQSEVIPSREFIEELFVTNSKKFGTQGPDCPDHWGGYIVYPEEVEFWQGRIGRLHDRIRYTKKDHSWSIDRLAP